MEVLEPPAVKSPFGKQPPNPEGLAEEAEALAEEIHRRWPPSAGAEALAKIQSHERLCAWRYKFLIERVTRLETIVIAAAGTLILGMASVLATLVIRAPLPPH
jgi:hypothetical protein